MDLLSVIHLSGNRQASVHGCQVLNSDLFGELEKYGSPVPAVLYAVLDTGTGLICYSFS